MTITVQFLKQGAFGLAVAWDKYGVGLLIGPFTVEFEKA